MCRENRRRMRACGAWPVAYGECSGRTTAAYAWTSPSLSLSRLEKLSFLLCSSNLSSKIQTSFLHCHYYLGVSGHTAKSKSASPTDSRADPHPNHHRSSVHCSLTLLMLLIFVQAYTFVSRWKSYFLHRPDEAVFNREEEENPDSRELSDEPWRRQVISNLAKHILFSKSAQ